MSESVDLWPLSAAKSLPVSARLRHALMSFAADAHMRERPDAAFARVRPLVRAAYAEIEAKRSADDAIANVTLSDAAVVGMFHFARAVADPAAASMIAPVACVAIGNYAMRRARPPRHGGLLILLDEHGLERARGERIAEFMALGFLEIGINVLATPRTVSDSMALADVLPPFRGILERRRYITGRFSLFAALTRALEFGEHASQVVTPAA
jgi:hypothetical protein